MADKPSVDMEWANNSVNEIRIIDDAPVSLANKTEPPQEFKDSALLYRQNLARAYLNYTLNLVSLWLKNLDERTSKVGVLHLTTDNTQTVGDLATRFGGTWTQRSNDTIGGQTTYVFERTA